MNSQVTPGAVTYMDILFVFIILAVVTALYFLFRAVIFKSLISKGNENQPVSTSPGCCFRPSSY